MRASTLFRVTMAAVPAVVVTAAAFLPVAAATFVLGG
jgi:hypothetical protein